jgi:lysophospholipase L1-like esterase
MGISQRLRRALVAIATLVAALAFAQTSAARSTAIVAMGDSEISGEGAGNYQAGTNGPNDYCHRSLNAWIMKVAIPVSYHINLACSGADAANLTIGGPGQYGEASQADQLARVAKTYAVKDIFVTVGANDDPNFSGTAEDCVFAYVFQTGDGCAQIDGPTWSSRVAAMEPKVENAIGNIATVMANDHYKSGSYRLYVVSYADPVADPPLRYSDSNYWGKVFAGCPLYDSDSQWGHDTATPVLDSGEQSVATAENTRFIDMVTGFDGHELCQSGISSSQQWVNGLVYDPNSTDWWNEHAVQQSFHPNAAGHSEIADCVGAFVPQTYRQGLCVVGSGGNLTVEPHP